jgi:hypothetical protein
MSISLTRYENNRSVTPDWDNVELVLPDLPEEVQAILAHSQAQDEFNEAEATANFEAAEARRIAIEDAERNLKHAKYALQSPTAHLHMDALKKRVRAAEHALKMAHKKHKSPVALAPKGTRMHTTRIAKFIGEIRRPQRPIVVKIPEPYSKTDTLSAICLVQSHKEARYSRKRELVSARLPLEEAIARFNASANRLAKDSNSVPFEEFSIVHEGQSGRFFQESVDLPPSTFTAACLGFLKAFGEDRLTKIYAKWESAGEFDDGVEILSMADRRRENAALDAEIDKLNWIEGALTRRAITEGNPDLSINPDLTPRQLIGLEEDPDAKVEEPKPGFVEVGDVVGHRVRV